MVTNSLQLLKQMVTSGTHLALTSELDAASELLEGTLVAIPMSDTKDRSQSISLAVSVKRSMPRICTMVSNVLVREINSIVEQVRAVK